MKILKSFTLDSGLPETVQSGDRIKIRYSRFEGNTPDDGERIVLTWSEYTNTGNRPLARDFACVGHCEVIDADGSAPEYWFVAD